MGILNSVLGAVFDILFAPLRPLGAWAGMAAVSLLTGVLMLLIFKKTSNQEGIRRAKDRIKAHLLEIRLYQSDFGLTMRAQGAVLRANARYMGHALRPMLVMLIPVLLILAQLSLRFQSAPLRRGEQALVKVALAEGVSAVTTDLNLEAPPGIVIETPPLRIEEDGEVAWRIRAEASGRHDLRFILGSASFTKSVAVETPVLTPVSSKRSRAFKDLVLFPGERPLPKSLPVVSVDVSHPARVLKAFGLRIHWLVAFFILSLAFGFAFKGVFKVEI